MVPAAPLCLWTPCTVSDVAERSIVGKAIKTIRFSLGLEGMLVLRSGLLGKVPRGTPANDVPPLGTFLSPAPQIGV